MNRRANALIGVLIALLAALAAYAIYVNYLTDGAQNVDRDLSKFKSCDGMLGAVASGGKEAKCFESASCTGAKVPEGYYMHSIGKGYGCPEAQPYCCVAIPGNKNPPSSTAIAATKHVITCPSNLHNGCEGKPGVFIKDYTSMDPKNACVYELFKPGTTERVWEYSDSATKGSCWQYSYKCPADSNDGCAGRQGTYVGHLEYYPGDKSNLCVFKLYKKGEGYEVPTFGPDTVEGKCWKWGG